MPERYDVSAGRKFLYYGGMALSAIGVLLFLSTFATFMTGFGGRGHFGATIMFRPFVGIILTGVGNYMRMVGARGLAGSGLILSPKRARKDLEPWARMAGGVVDDALSEVKTFKRPSQPTQERTVVKVRCRDCGSLNPETAKFCNQCGRQL